jgi:hypothetical protein
MMMMIGRRRMSLEVQVPRRITPNLVWHGCTDAADIGGERNKNVKLLWNWLTNTENPLALTTHQTARLKLMNTVMLMTKQELETETWIEP